MVGGSTLENPEEAKTGREIERKKWGAPPEGYGSESTEPASQPGGPGRRDHNRGTPGRQTAESS